MQINAIKNLCKEKSKSQTKRMRDEKNSKKGGAKLKLRYLYV